MVSSAAGGVVTQGVGSTVVGCDHSVITAASHWSAASVTRGRTLGEHGRGEVSGHIGGRATLVLYVPFLDDIVVVPIS